jgi:hypothetical protein
VTPDQTHTETGPRPHRPTVLIGIAMIALGGGTYLATGMGSMTALIPSFIGVPVLVCGLAAARARSAALIAAAALGVLGLLGPLGRIVPTAAKGELAIGPALISQIVFMLLAATLVVLAIAAWRGTRRA